MPCRGCMLPRRTGGPSCAPPAGLPTPVASCRSAAGHHRRYHPSLAAPPYMIERRDPGAGVVPAEARARDVRSPATRSPGLCEHPWKRAWVYRWPACASTMTRRLWRGRPGKAPAAEGEARELGRLAAAGSRVRVLHAAPRAMQRQAMTSAEDLAPQQSDADESSGEMCGPGVIDGQLYMCCFHELPQHSPCGDVRGKVFDECMAKSGKDQRAPSVAGQSTFVLPPPRRTAVQVQRHRLNNAVQNQMQGGSFQTRLEPGPKGPGLHLEFHEISDFATLSATRRS